MYVAHSLVYALFYLSLSFLLSFFLISQKHRFQLSLCSTLPHLTPSLKFNLFLSLSPSLHLFLIQPLSLSVSFFLPPLFLFHFFLSLPLFLSHLLFTSFSLSLSTKNKLFPSVMLCKGNEGLRDTCNYSSFDHLFTCSTTSRRKRRRRRKNRFFLDWIGSRTHKHLWTCKFFTQFSWYEGTVIKSPQVQYDKVLVTLHFDGEATDRRQHLKWTLLL